MRWIDTEKPALVETLRHADPEAPTLCESWTTRHLLAHLVQREQNLLANPRRHDRSSTAGPGEVPGPVGRGSPDTRGVRRARLPVRRRPGSVVGDELGAETLNFTEYVIHHEDLRRGGETPAEPRVLPEEEQRSIWKRVLSITRFVYRRAPVGVTLATPGGDVQQVRKGEPAVVLTGEPAELLLYISGRRKAARVEVSGDPDAVAHFEPWVVKLLS